MAERVEAYRETNGLPADTPVPVDAVTASGSGLDPHISSPTPSCRPNASPTPRGLPLEEVLALIDDHTAERSLGFLGEKGVHVLELNLDLDRAAS